MKFVRLNGQLIRVNPAKRHYHYVSTQGWVAIGVLGAIGLLAVYAISKAPTSDATTDSGSP